MANEVLEKKVSYIGSWSDNTFTDTIIREVATHVQLDKGSKVRLHLSRDGIRVIKSNIIQGRYLHNFIPLLNIYYIIVNQYNPNCVLVISKSDKTKYRIFGFRCANGLDAGRFVQTFKEIHKSLKPGVGYNFDLKTHDGINWTLRSKSSATNTNTRQLSQLVDIHGEKAVIQQNGKFGTKTQYETNNNTPKQQPRIADLKTTEVQVQSKGDNSPSSGSEFHREIRHSNGQIIHEASVQVVTKDEDIRDSVSETSDNLVIRDELDHLSHEIKEIKFMLEKSTGISAEEYHKKAPVHHEQNYNRNMASDLMDAEILPDNYEMVVVNETYTKEKNENGENEVKVSVPDYRSFGTQTAPKSKRQTTSSSDVTEMRAQRPTSVNYDKWRNSYISVPTKSDSVRLRNNVVRSKTLSTSRPRSAIYTNKRWVPVELDISQNATLRNPNRVSFTPTLSSDPNSVRVRTTTSFSTTVRRPIEKVYQRPSMFRSLVYRPPSTREHHAATYVLTPEDENSQKIYHPSSVAILDEEVHVSTVEKAHSSELTS